MSHTYDPGRPPTAERTAGRGIVVAGDRTQNFKQAKRHSSRVRTLRIALPVMTLGIMGIYGLTLLKGEFGPKLPELKIPDILPENLTMDNPHYEGFGKDGSAYSIQAATAQQDLKNTSLIKLNAISGTLTELDKSKTALTATRGVFDHTSSILELADAIDIKADSGLKAKLKSATLNTKDGLVTSKEPVLVEFPGGSVRSNSMTLRQKSKEVTFVDTVIAKLQPPKKDPAAAAAALAKGPAPGAFAASDMPVDITAQRLDIRDQQKTATFVGNVVAIQGDSAITTPELEVHYVGSAASSLGAKPAPAPQAAQAAATPGAGKVNKILAKGPVVMTRGATDRVTCEHAEFDTAASTAVLAGNVLMTAGADRRATSDRADLDSANDTALLTGDVVVNSGANEMRGRRLLVNRKAQQMNLSTPGGRIAARFVQSAPKAGAAKKPAPGAAASGFATFKTDPNAPVEIDAETLEANDAKKVAIFRGDVKAKQGGFVIRTPELQATYSGEAGLSDVAGTDAANGPAKPQTQLTRIEAKKKVLVTSADGQTVSGDWAIFETATNSVTVGGDVMLSQNKNVVRGTRLVIDMTTGESTIQTATAAQKAASDGWTSAPGGPGGTPAQGRPSAVFYPDQLKALRGDEPKAPPAPAKGAATEWGASTTPQSLDQGGN